MKILMIGPFPPVVNGVTVCNDFLYQWLIARGENVSYINTETGKIASKQGDKISLSKIFTFLRIYKSLHQVFGKSIVYMAIGQTFWGLAKYSPFIILCKLLSIPYVLHIHGGYVCKAYEEMSPSKRYIFKRLLQDSKTVIALSNGLATDLKGTFPKAQVEVVENFYDPRLIEQPIERTIHAKPRFIFLSNLMLGKGILDFLDALLLLKANQQLEFEVAVAGGIEKGIYDIINEKIKSLGDSVHFFGLADFEKKKELLYWSDIFVLPTWYIMEGQPISIIEAYVTGNVVVSTDQGGITDISGYGSFFKAEKQHAGKLAATLVEINKQLPQLTQNVIDTQLATQKRFDPDVFLEKIRLILHQV